MVFLLVDLIGTGGCSCDDLVVVVGVYEISMLLFCDSAAHFLLFFYCWS